MRASRTSRTWNLGWVLSDGIDVEGSEQVQPPPDIDFENGGIEGSSGCNEYIATYTADMSALDLELGPRTGLSCPGPRDEVEAAFLAALEDVAGWALEDDELVLLDASDEELLRFARRTG